MQAENLRHLKNSQEKYRTIFEWSRDAIFLIDQKGKIMEINQAGIDILGYETREELSALKSAAALFENKDDFHRFRKKTFRDGFVTEFESRISGAKGRAFDALTTASAILDEKGQITGYVIIIRDSTKQKAAQEQIKKQNFRLAALNAISMKANSSLDLGETLKSTIGKILELLESDGVRVYLLDEKQQMLNLVAHEGLLADLIAKNHMRRRKVGEGVLGKAVQKTKPVVINHLEKEPDNPYVLSLIHAGVKSTIYIPLLSKGSPVGVMCVSSYSTLKSSPGYVEFLTAIGNQIGMAVENANLFEHVNHAYQKLKEAQEQILRAEKLSSLGKLAATIAHEINNPLAAVLTYIRLMIKLIDRSRFTPERLDDISRYLNTMETEIARCGEIVKNLLAFSRQSKISMQPCSIGEIIDKALVLIAHDLKIRGIKVVKQIEPDTPKFLCDFKQIQQVLLNLFSNASEAMDAGGTLTVTARHSDDNCSLEVMISDTGCGIPEDKLKDIFEPFYTTKEEGKGVGLGLSVVYGIISKHNGTVNVETEPEKGSRFNIRFPLSRPEKPNKS
ncbi:MAG: ATP-binding protein [Thermodesulfobacteriota bacterium]|nr:ATP-binding protein [Thermodesulfobacteriota bacterium]